MISGRSIPFVIKCRPSLAPRKAEFATAAFRAQKIIEAFARRHGWLDYTREPFFHAMEVYQSQDDLWRRMQQLESLPRERKPPVAGLAAGLLQGMLLAVTPEEYRRIRPEYASKPEGWTRLLAHELAHGLHVRLVKGNENAMGPEWFFEGFAITASGQHLCGSARPGSLAEALSDAAHQGPGSYVFYERAFRFFLERVPLEKMIQKAGSPDFDDWLRSR
jgi:hypothetical protein